MTENASKIIVPPRRTGILWIFPVSIVILCRFYFILTNPDYFKLEGDPIFYFIDAFLLVLAFGLIAAGLRILKGESPLIVDNKGLHAYTGLLSGQVDIAWDNIERIEVASAESRGLRYNFLRIIPKDYGVLFSGRSTVRKAVMRTVNLGAGKHVDVAQLIMSEDVSDVAERIYKYREMNGL